MTIHLIPAALALLVVAMASNAVFVPIAFRERRRSRLLRAILDLRRGREASRNAPDHEDLQ